jgi:Reverse gyrase
VDFRALPALYLHSCPNCGGAVESYRLAEGLPCSECLPREAAGGDIKRIIEDLRRRNALRELAPLADNLRRYEEIGGLFERVVGFRMWGAQRLWARRLAAGKSFAVVAPTGSGKTTFLLVSALYMAGRGKALLVFPTSALAYQAYRKLLDYSSRGGLALRIATYKHYAQAAGEGGGPQEDRGGRFRHTGHNLGVSPQVFRLAGPDINSPSWPQTTSIAC